MTVVQVTHYMPPHPGGIERVADTLFDAYRAAGLTVEWIASRVPSDAPRREPGKQRVRSLNVLETMLDVPVPLWGPGALRVLTAAVRRADVVHVHDCLYPGSALAMRAARRYNKPTLLTQHIGFVTYRTKLLNAIQRGAYATLGRRLLRQASRVVLATPAAEAQVRQLFGAMPPHATVIPNGIDLGRFRPATDEARHQARQHLALDTDAQVVLFTGRLVEKKGLPLVLDVARRLQSVRVLVIGNGPLAPRMKEATSNVQWVPSVRPEEMTRFYQAADCLLMPSTGEGLPLVVQEALASGLPVIAAECEPYAAALAAAGIIVPAPRDADRLTAEVQGVLASRQAATAARARRYSEEHWDVKVMARRYLRLLHTLVSDPGAFNAGPA